MASGRSGTHNRRHSCKLLGWYKAYDNLQQARLRELQMKRWKRLWKLTTIEAMNAELCDLYLTLSEGSSRSLSGPLPSQEHDI